MESEFPSNSQSRRERDVPERQVPAKKIERIVEGEVIRRKKPLRRRFAETFFGGSARMSWQYVTMEVIIPGAKDMFLDALNQGFERMIWPDAQPRGRSRRRSGEGRYNTPYNRFSSPSHDRDRRDEVRISRRARANHDFDEIILPSRVEAEEVIDQLFSIVEKYEIVTVADLYQLVGISSDYTDDKYGWEDLRGAGVTRIAGGYLLDLPRPEPLK